MQQLLEIIVRNDLYIFIYKYIFWLIQHKDTKYITSSPHNIGPSVLRAPAEQTKVATVFGN